jgi:outer membrane protein assembly factor BamB
MTRIRSQRARSGSLWSRPRSPRWLAQTLLAAVACAWVATRASAQQPGPGLVQPAAPAAVRFSAFRPDSSFEAERLLRNAAGHARNGQWAEAIDQYARATAELGGSMAQAPRDPADLLAAESTLFIDVRQYCQSQIAAMPPEALALYRRRVDAQAEAWFKRGVEAGDADSLRRVVDEAFCSSWGDDALERLGDLAFRAGRFREALALYGRLVPDPARPADGLAYPDPQIDLAGVAARILLARAALGDHPPTPDDLAAYATAYPGASGPLAGRKGPYAEALAHAIDADRLAPTRTLDARWTTFAGSPARSFVAPGTVDVGSLQWRVPLDPVEKAPEGGMQTFLINRRFGGPIPGSPARSQGPKELAYFPIVVGDQVVVAEANRVVAYNLTRQSPTAETVGDAPATSSAPVPVAWDQALAPAFSARPARIVQGAARYTLTAHGDRIYARLGPSSPRLGASFLMAIRNNREVEGKLLWKRASTDLLIPPRRAAGARAEMAFEGTPVADDQGVYVALTEVGTMTSAHVACLDPDTGDVRWTRFLGEGTPVILDAGFGPSPDDDTGTRLLTLDGPTLYYQTNQGAVAALDAATGALRWLATYPPGAARPARRDLAPAAAADGLVLVAPADAPEVFAFDAASGRLRWKSQPLPEADHLLGLVAGRVVLTGNRVWLLDAATGRLAAYWPQGGGGLEGRGRGLLAAGLVYWPTRSEIRIVDPATGLEHPSGPIKLEEAFGTGGGNLALGDGYLVVAQPDGLAVFCQNRRLIERYREVIAASPDRAAGYVRLARVAESTGQDLEALDALDSAITRARPAESLDGEPLLDTAHAQRYRLAMRLARADLARSAWDDAAQRFQIAADSARTDRDRLAAHLERADALVHGDDPESAVALYQQLLADERLARVDAAAGPERSLRADRLVADRLAQLVRSQGPDLYAPYDRRARDLLDRATEADDPHLLDELVRSYPAAAVVPDALLARAAIDERQGRHADAGHAYQQLLHRDAGDVPSARALLGLARSYEARGLGPAARDAFAEAQARFPALRLPGDSRSVGSLAAEGIARQGPDGDLAARPELDVPLRRRWSARWPGADDARPLPIAGTPPTPATGRILLVHGPRVGPIDPATGQVAWTADLNAPALSATYLTDRLIVATASRVVALDFATGQPRWSYGPDANDPALAPDDADALPRNPFARPGRTPGPDGASPLPDGPLRQVRAANGRVYALQGDRLLLALDAETGQVEWSLHVAADQSIGPRWMIHADRVLVQRLGASPAILLLDAASGLRLAEQAQPPGAALAWTRDPQPIDDQHAAIVAEDRSVSLLDLQAGALVWSYREPPALPRGAPPRVLGDRSRLLVLRDGSELVRLDPATGQKLWSRLLGLEDLGESPDALALDGNRVYAICGPGPALAAYDLDHGNPLWSRPLSGGPPSGWTLHAAGRFLVAHPNPPHAQQADDPLHNLPLVVCERDSGRLVQRLLLPAEITGLAVHIAPGAALVATQDRGWALDAAPPGP